MIKVTIEIIIDDTTIHFEKEIGYLAMNSTKKAQVEQAIGLFTKGINIIDKALESQK